MDPDTRASNARWLANASLLAMGIFALLTLSDGVVMIVRGLHDRNSDLPSSSFGFIGNPDVAALLSMLWVASVVGMWISAIFGVIALARLRTSWVRVVSFGFVAPAVAITTFWLTQRFDAGADPRTRGASELAEGRDLVALVVVGAVLMTWLLKPALVRRAATPMPPPDPATRFYSDRTT